MTVSWCGWYDGMMVPDSAWARRKFREKDMTIRRLLAYRKVRELQWQLKLERERAGNNWKQLETGTANWVSVAGIVRACEQPWPGTTLNAPTRLLGGNVGKTMPCLPPIWEWFIASIWWCGGWCIIVLPCFTHIIRNYHGIVGVQ